MAAARRTWRAGRCSLSATGLPLPLVGSHTLPPLLAPNVGYYALLRALHTWIGELFFALGLGHILAGLAPALLLRDGVFQTISLRQRSA